MCMYVHIMVVSNEHVFCRSYPPTSTTKSEADDTHGTSTALEQDDEEDDEEYSSSEENEEMTNTQSSLSKLSSARGFSPQPDHHSDC